MTQGPDETLCTLLRERTSPNPISAAGRVLAAHVDIPPTDAIARIRYGGGLIANNIHKNTAEKLAVALGEIGMSTRRIEAEQWAVVSPGYQAMALEFLEDTLLVRLQTGAELVIPRDEVFGLDVYLLRPPEGREESESGNRKSGTSSNRLRSQSALAYLGDTTRQIPGDDEPMEGILLTQETPTRSPRAQVLLENLQDEEYASMELRAALFCAEPSGRLHLRKDRFDYSCLKEQKLKHSIDNFLLLLEELLTQLPSAWNQEPVREFLRNLKPSKIARFKQEETESFHRWMLQWVRLESEEGGGRATTP